MLSGVAIELGRLEDETRDRRRVVVVFYPGDVVGSCRDGLVDDVGGGIVRHGVAQWIACKWAYTRRSDWSGTALATTFNVEAGQDRSARGASGLTQSHSNSS